MSELQHHGILGMKWGVRRWQNKDGSLTAEGKKRYGSDYDDVPHAVKESEKSSGKSGSSDGGSSGSRTNQQALSSEKKNDTSGMTDAELQKAVNRKRLEQDYARLNDNENKDQNQNNQNNQNNQQNMRVDSSELRGKSVSELTDKELQIVLDRINLEKRYSEAIATPSKIDKAKKVVNVALATGTTIAGALGTYVTIRKWLNAIQTGNYGNAGGGKKKS